MTKEERREAGEALNVKIAELRERGWSFERIGRRLNVSANTVSWRCLINGIEKPGSSAPKPYRGPMVIARNGREVRRFTPDEDEMLLALERDKLPYCAIGRRLGRKRNVVVTRLATLARRDERAMGANV